MTLSESVETKLTAGEFFRLHFYKINYVWKTSLFIWKMLFNKICNFAQSLQGCPHEGELLWCLHTLDHVQSAVKLRHDCS